jgi:hypothetical protein
MNHPIAYWCRLWQTQIEASLAVMAIWARMIPHQNAAALSAEAEASHTAPTPLRPVKARRKAA